jgi:hypothetical protein
VGGDTFFQRGASFKQRPQCFGRFYWLAVTHFSSVAGSMPPHRGAVLKQRPEHNLLCLFRARLLGERSITGSPSSSCWRRLCSSTASLSRRGCCSPSRCAGL